MTFRLASMLWGNSKRYGGNLNYKLVENLNIWSDFNLVNSHVLRLLFWSTCGWENMIMKAGLDGSNRTKLVSANISCATSLSVDSGRQRLYWVDRTHGTSSSIYYDGQIRHNVHDPRVQTVTVLRDKILWTSSSDQWLFINQSSWSKEIFIGFEVCTYFGCWEKKSIKFMKTVSKCCKNTQCYFWNTLLILICITSPL